MCFLVVEWGQDRIVDTHTAVYNSPWFECRYLYVCMSMCTHECMHVCMHVCMYVFMCICMCVYVWRNVSRGLKPKGRKLRTDFSLRLTIDTSIWTYCRDHAISELGTFGIFYFFKLIFCIFYQVNNLFLHQSYLKSPLPVKLT